MSFEESDPLASISKGAAVGVLNWGSERISGLVQKFKNRDLAFIEDYETINSVKEQRKTGEWDLFKKYIQDKDYHILFQMGLTLRANEKEGKNYDSIIKKILKKFDINGLHVAYFCANGLFGKYVSLVLERGYSAERVSKDLTELFSDIDKRVSFIQKDDMVKEKAVEIVTKIHSNNPDIFILSSSYSTAMQKCRTAKEEILGEISGYDCEEFNAPNRQIYFITRNLDDFL